MVYGLWHWLKIREHNLKTYNSRDTRTTWKTENVIPNLFSTK